MRTLLLALSLLAASPAGASELFWKHWSDGQAELNGYDLVRPRYGEMRHGRTVLVYVTEPFSRSRRVKVDRHDPNDPDQLTVIKLNRMDRFQTGVYDYGLMTSVFADPQADFRPLKITFSGQEWCGQVYEELRFDPGKATIDLRSYFEGETGAGSVAIGADALAEDALFISVRQLAREKLAGGEARHPLVPSATFRRLQHKPFALHETTLAWSAAPKPVTVPAGTFQVLEATYTRADGAACTFEVEAPYPHRLVGWRCADGERARLTGSTRLPYWKTHAEGDEKLLQQLGLTPSRYAP